MHVADLLVYRALAHCRAEGDQRYGCVSDPIALLSDIQLSEHLPSWNKIAEDTVRRLL